MGNTQAYIPGYEHDIFVSYAHVDDNVDDNPVIKSQKKGWVSTFLGCLEDELTRRLGRDDSYSLWFDRTHLDGHSSISNEILTSLKGTAILIVIVSPGYLASDWCTAERQAFMKLIEDEHFKNVFIVEQNEVEQRPPALTDRKGYRFWHKNPTPTTFGYPVLSQTQEDYPLYIREMNKLAYELTALMKKLKDEKDGEMPAKTPRDDDTSADTDDNSSQVTIYVAEPTDDLSQYSDRLSRTLQKKGFCVLPAPGDYLPRKSEQFKQTVDSSISRSELFVQLAGPVRSRTIKGSEETYGSYQFRRAKSRFDDAELDVMIWFSEGSQTDPQLEEDDYARKLLEEQLQCSVHECDFENFQEDVINRAEDILKEKIDKTTLPTEGGQQSIFIKCQARDWDIARQIGKVTGDLDFFSLLPPDTKDSSAFREAWDRNDEVSDVTIVLYGPHSDSSWVQMQCVKSFSIKRQRQQRFFGFIVEVPPPREKPDPGVLGVRRLLPHPDVDQFDEEELRKALQDLRHSIVLTAH